MSRGGLATKFIMLFFQEAFWDRASRYDHPATNVMHPRLALIYPIYNSFPRDVELGSM